MNLLISFITIKWEEMANQLEEAMKEPEETEIVSDNFLKNTTPS